MANMKKLGLINHLKTMKTKDKIILTAALILPLGLPVLGIWKAVELYKKGDNKDEENNNNSSNIASSQNSDS